MRSLQRAVEQAGGVWGAVVAALEVGSCDGVGEQRVAADQRVLSPIRMPIMSLVCPGSATTCTVWSPSGEASPSATRPRPAWRSGRRERAPRAERWSVAPRASGELARAGEVVGVDMRVEHAGDPRASPRGLVQVRLHVGRGVDDERLAVRRQEVGEAAARLAAELHDRDRAGERDLVVLQDARPADQASAHAAYLAPCGARVRRRPVAMRCRRCR